MLLIKQLIGLINWRWWGRRWGRRWRRCHRATARAVVAVAVTTIAAFAAFWLRRVLGFFTGRAAGTTPASDLFHFFKCQYTHVDFLFQKNNHQVRTEVLTKFPCRSLTDAFFTVHQIVFKFCFCNKFVTYQYHLIGAIFVNLSQKRHLSRFLGA